MNNAKKKSRQITSWLLMLCMMFSMLTGCKKDDTTLFSVIREAKEFDSYTVEGNGEFTLADEKANVEMSGKVNGNDWAFSINLVVDEYEVNLGEVMIYLDDSLYVNAESIADAVSAFIPGINVKSVIENIYNVPLGWYEFPMPENVFAVNGEMYKEYDELSMTILEEALSGIEIQKDKSTFTIDISEPEQIATIMDNMAAILENHESDFMKYVSELDSAQLNAMMAEIVEIYGNAMINVMVRLNEEKNLGATQADIQEVRDEIQDEINRLQEEEVEEFTEEMKEELQTEFAETVIQLRESAEEIRNYDMGDDTFSCVITNSLSGKKDQKEYKVTVELLAVSEQEEVSGKLEYIKKQEAVEITVPENTYLLEDWLYNVLSAVIEMSGEEM